MELEILEYNESGYNPLVSYNGWRVAVANCAQKWGRAADVYGTTSVDR